MTGIVCTAGAPGRSLPVAADCSPAVDKYEALFDALGDGVVSLVPCLLGVAVVDTVLVASQADGAGREDGAG